MSLFYEKRNGDQTNLKDSENRWNERAEEFYRRSDNMSSAQDLINFLDENFDLSGKNVLEIGFGIGKHIALMAEKNANISGVELSRSMIDFAEKFWEKRGVDFSNFNIFKVAWENINIFEKGFYRKFDLVFMSHCPVISEPEGLKKAVDCTTDSILLSTHLVHGDSLIDELKSELGIENRRDRERDFLSLKEFLGMEGFLVKETVLSYKAERVVDLASDFNGYAHRIFGECVSESDREKLMKIMKSKDSDSRIKTLTDTVNGVIFGKRTR